MSLSRLFSIWNQPHEKMSSHPRALRGQSGAPASPHGAQCELQPGGNQIRALHDRFVTALSQLGANPCQRTKIGSPGQTLLLEVVRIARDERIEAGMAEDGCTLPTGRRLTG